MPEPGVDPTFSIVARTPQYAIVSKSGNLPCHAAGAYRTGTLESLLRERTDFAEVHLVNRLDRETSGLVVVALSADAAGALGRLFEQRRVEKRYLAWVSGSPPDAFTAAGTLYLCRGDIVLKKRLFVPRLVIPDFIVNGQDIDALRQSAWTRDEVPPPPRCSDARNAATAFRVIERREDLSLLEVHPHTGRPHQIRATLRALGFPIVGDKLYGPDETIYARLCSGAITTADRAALRFPRQALHAFSLAFRDPFTREHVRYESPMPADIQP